MKFKKYKDVVYGINYCFIFDVTDIKKLPEFIKKNDRKIYKWYIAIDKDDRKDFAGRTIHSSNNVMIVLKKEKDYNYLISVLVHELLHSMFFVFGERGVELQDGGSNEHATYYLDHLVYEALK